MQRIIGREWALLLSMGLVLVPVAVEAGIKHKGNTPLVPVLVAPVQGVTYQAPTTTVYGYSSSVATVGNAPTAVAGTRIKAVDRSDIIEEAQAEASKNQTGLKSARRKQLTETITTKYTEAIGGDAESLNQAERNDIDNIVNSIIDGHAAGSAPVGGTYGYGYSAPAPVMAPATPAYYSAPAPLLAPAAPTYYSAPPVLYGTPALVQPMVPVQVWIPTQPKHHWFNKH